MKKLNGCHNRSELKTRATVQDGWFMDGVTRTARMVCIPVPMARQCQYTHTALGQADAACDGCKWKSPPKRA